MQLLLGDCNQLIKDIPDNSIDLIIIDPPYTQIAGGGGGCFGLAHRNYLPSIGNMGLYEGFNHLIIDDFFRVLKTPNIYIFCSKNEFIPLLNEFVTKRGCSFTLLSWHKSNPIPACHNRYLLDTEYILHFRKNCPIYGTYETKKTYMITPVNKADKKKYGHPTIKPIEVIKPLIINSSKEGDVVLDTFMGTGSTGVACKELNRNFIGIEANSDTYKIAEDRVLRGM